jgi:hypothetical protein
VPFALIALRQPLLQAPDFITRPDFGQEANAGFNGRAEQSFEGHLDFSSCTV